MSCSRLRFLLVEGLSPDSLAAPLGSWLKAGAGVGRGDEGSSLWVMVAFCWADFEMALSCDL